MFVNTDKIGNFFGNKELKARACIRHVRLQIGQNILQKAGWTENHQNAGWAENLQNAGWAENCQNAGWAENRQNAGWLG
jgi:hypothetical protein